MNKKISTLAIAALFSIAAVSANAGDTVTYNGFNYLLNFENITYEGNEAKIQSTPWWGNRSLALALSGLYKPSGYPDFTDFHFAYAIISLPNYVDSEAAMKWPSEYGGWTSSTSMIPLTLANDYMFATSVTPVPEADTSAMLLMGAGLMGFIARRRKQVAA